MEKKLVELMRKFELSHNEKMEQSNIKQVRMEEHIKQIVDSGKRIEDKLDTHISKCDSKYAPRWVMYPLYGMLATIFAWVLNQILEMIPKASALISYYITTA